MDEMNATGADGDFRENLVGYGALKEFSQRIA